MAIDEDEDSRFWFGTPEDYVLGYIEGVDEEPQFHVLNTIRDKLASSGSGPSASR